MFKILLPLLLLTGCGYEPLNSRHNRIVDVGDFEYYVDLFQVQAKILGQEINIDDLKIQWKYLPVKESVITLGTCLYSEDSTPLISIDPGHWVKLSLVSKKILMFHELGHCILKRNHIENPLSIMNPSLLSEKIFDKNQDRLLAELFDRSRYNTISLMEETDGSSGTYHDCGSHLHSGFSNRLGN